MGKPDADEIEIAAGAKAITDHYGKVIGEGQARNIAYHVLVAARGAKIKQEEQTARAQSSAQWQTYFDAAMKEAAANGYNMTKRSAEAIAIDLLDHNTTFEGAYFDVIKACAEDWLQRQPKMHMLKGEKL